MSANQRLLTTSLYLAYKNMQRFFCVFAQKHGLAPAQWGALKKLCRNDGLTISELSEKMFLKNSTMTTLIDRMERDGLVYRVRTREDRRIVRIFLTDKGITLNNQLPDFDKEVEKILDSNMSKDEIETLIALLNKLSEKMIEQTKINC